MITTVSIVIFFIYSDVFIMINFTFLTIYYGFAMKIIPFSEPRQYSKHCKIYNFRNTHS